MKNEELTLDSTQNVASTGTFILVLKKNDQIVHENSDFNLIRLLPFTVNAVENGFNWITITREEQQPLEAGEKIIGVDDYFSEIHMASHGMGMGHVKAHQGTINFIEASAEKVKGHYELHYVSREGENFTATGEFDVEV
ncbi:hypothetical protein ACQKPE_04125 [Pseudomonas sp. NPDC089554]|uniref:hypothetical protein n=1 Tax=Pseudomonas sp. NPDC089554 TaxID=3390653 RepID=UPI003D029A6B